MSEFLRVSYDTYQYCSCADILNAIYKEFDERGFKDYVKPDIIDEFYYNVKSYLQPILVGQTNRSVDFINNLDEIISNFTDYVSGLTILKNTLE